ncbi:MAG: plasmid pRiA4b ORF-3 family protein [Promethearchaeota archaeon]|nr:MAG: plasmid pRiA4b ORF-3 family protein [Candidatus Lokiarchaeota archaeon]
MIGINMENLQPCEGLEIPKKGVKQRLFQLKITLRGINPPVWRRVVLSSYTSFSKLHELIQEYFSWEGYHLHEFYFPHPKNPRDRVRIMGIIEWDEDVDMSYYHFLANNVRLCDVLSKDQKRVYYLYDFGDNWIHLIQLEKMYPYDERFVGPLCVGGKRAAPPEDSGGPYGFQENLKFLEKLNQESVEGILKWMGKDYDPHKVKEIGIRLSPKKLEGIFGPSL